MKKPKMAGLLIILIILLYIYRNYFSVVMICGSYANTNFDHGMRVAEVPHKPDTLILLDDMTFKSSYYGEGSYRLNYSWRGTEIVLVYDHGRAGSHSDVSRSLLGNIQISLISDMGQYYSKFD